MQGEISRGKRRKRKRNKLRTTLNFSQEKASYFFFIGLLIIAIFGCVASGAPRQGFYGILFVSIGILIALFPPVFITSKWLSIGLILFFVSLSASLLPRSFASSQSWRISLENLGLETGNLISPHPAATIESLVIIGSVIIIGLCALGHRISRDSFLKLSALFVIAVASYTAISMLFERNEWEWGWDPNSGFGFFANRNHMATLMVIGSLVGVGSLFGCLKKKNSLGFVIILLATIIICWGILGYSISRAGLILFISFQIIWFLFAWKKHLDYRLVISFLVLFILTVFLFILSDTKLEDRLKKLLDERKIVSKSTDFDGKSDYTSILGLRKYIHADTYEMIKAEPWTGSGLGTYEFIFPFYKKESIIFDQRASFSNVLHPESNWLDLTSKAGILSVLFLLICIFPLLISVLFRNRKSRLWVLSLSCILSAFCILIHGIVDVPGQKIGIVMSVIFLIGITQKSHHNQSRVPTRYLTFTYQVLGVGVFSLGLILVNSQWFSSMSINFSDSKIRMNKIQNLYNLSINAARGNDTKAQKKYIISAIELTDKAIKRSPLDADLHFVRGKLYSYLDGSEDKIKSSFEIESTLDPTWIYLPLRQAQVWLFVDINETRRLWSEVLERSRKIDEKYSRKAWDRILDQARKNPIQIRDTYKIVMNKDDSYYIMRWMDFAGKKNIHFQLPKILQSQFLGTNTKKDISARWKSVSPEDYEKYLKSTN